MDGYFQSTLATSSLPRCASSNIQIFQPLRLIKPCPPVDKSFNCDEIHLPEGIYRLANETSLNIAPQFSTGTHASVINAKITPTHLNIPSTVSNVSPGSSFSEEGASASASDEAVYSNGMITEETTIEKYPESGAEIPEPTRNDFTQPTSALPIPKSTSQPSVKGPELPITFNTETNLPAVLASPKSFSSSCIPVLPNAPFSEAQTNTLPPKNASRSKMNSRTTLSSLPFLSVESTAEESVSIQTSGSSNTGSLSSLFGRSSNKHTRHHHHHRKAKKSLSKTNSSFVSKMIVHDQLTNKLASYTDTDSFLFFNVGASFVWMDANSSPKDPLSRIVFANAYPTSHDVNKHTNSIDGMDIIIGFSSGDCVWYDPIGRKYLRLNKECIMANSAVTMVKWLPESDNLFMASFADGSVLILDKDREDQSFTPAPPSCWAEYQFQATRPHKGSKYNPVAHWRVSKTGIIAFDFSPDGRQVAIVGMDGTLRIVDSIQERLMDVYSSFFGQLLCVAWSPDGRYLLTGGQDDLVTIWSAFEKKIVARCQGHKSWISGVAFDPWKCDDRVYRFGSVGEDSRLILWDFSYSALHRPRNIKGHLPSITHPNLSPKSPQFTIDGGESISREQNNRFQSSLGSGPTFGRFRRRPSRSTTVLGGPSPRNTAENRSGTSEEPLHMSLPTLHPVSSKDQVPYLQPRTVQRIHADPCVDILFRKDCIVTTDRRGHIRTWRRL